MERRRAAGFSAADFAAAGHARPGWQLYPITYAFQELYRLPADQQGVLVTGVMPTSPADGRGLRVGDVIVSVQAKTPADIMQHFERWRRQGRKYVLLLVWDNNASRTVALPLGGGSSPQRIRNRRSPLFRFRQNSCLMQSWGDASDRFGRTKGPLCRGHIADLAHIVSHQSTSAVNARYRWHHRPLTLM